MTHSCLWLIVTYSNACGRLCHVRLWMMLRCENAAVQSIILDMADLEGLAGLEEQRTSTRTRERTMDSNRDMSVNSQDSVYSDEKVHNHFSNESRKPICGE